MSTAGRQPRESKRDRFSRVVTARTNKVLAMLRLIGNCANRIIYGYTEDEVAQVFAAIQCGVARAKEQYQANASGKKKRFSLSDKASDFPRIEDGRLLLPDGTALLSKMYDDRAYPAINIYRIAADGTEELLCFVEQNSEKEPGHELCIGAYCASEEDTVFYDSYVRNEEQETTV